LDFEEFSKESIFDKIVKYLPLDILTAYEVRIFEIFYQNGFS
jgi:hypothetical protein